MALEIALPFRNIVARQACLRPSLTLRSIALDTLRINYKSVFSHKSSAFVCATQHIDRIKHEKTSFKGTYPHHRFYSKYIYKSML